MKDDLQRQRDKDRKLDEFVEDLRRYASAFRWFVDTRGLRAEHPEVSHCLCPLGAVYFATTGKAVRSAATFGAADEEMGLRLISLDVAVAADDRLDSPLGKRLQKAVGLNRLAA